MFKSINKVVKNIIYWDLFFNSAWGLLTPIFAVFLIENITHDSSQAAQVAGFAALIYWVLKSLLQIPIGAYLDKNHGEKDDYWFMLSGTILIGLVSFGYLLVSLPEHIYMLQAISAIGMSMLIPSSYAIFTRHIDKGKEAYEWSVDSTVLGFGAGITGAAGGLIAGKFGFDIIFILTGILYLASAIFLLSIKKYMSPRNVDSLRFPPTKPAEKKI